MASLARLVTRLIVVVCLLTASITPHQPAAAADANVSGEQAITRSEVRLRKLHLVRPDLIPYPIAYEVCC